MKVTLTDKGLIYPECHHHFVEASGWAVTHCRSYKSYEIIDVSDHSYEHDSIAVYIFEDEKDAVFFKLRWS
jgi:hypothetical protein